MSVLHDVDVEPASLGVTLPGSPTVWVPWASAPGARRARPRDADGPQPADGLAARPPLGRRPRARTCSRCRCAPSACRSSTRCTPGWTGSASASSATRSTWASAPSGSTRPTPERVVLLPPTAVETRRPRRRGRLGRRARPPGGARRAGGRAAGARPARPAAAVRRLRRGDPARRPQPARLAGRAGRGDGRGRRADAPARLDRALPHRPGLRPGRRGRDVARGARLRAAAAAHRRRADPGRRGRRPEEIVLRDPAADRPWVRDVLYR